MRRHIVQSHMGSLSAAKIGSAKMRTSNSFAHTRASGCCAAVEDMVAQSSVLRCAALRCAALAGLPAVAMQTLIGKPPT